MSGSYSRNKCIQIRFSEREYNLIKHHAKEHTFGNMAQWIRIAAIKYIMPPDKSRSLYEADKLKELPIIKL